MIEELNNELPENYEELKKAPTALRIGEHV